MDRRKAILCCERRNYGAAGVKQPIRHYKYSLGTALLQYRECSFNIVSGLDRH
jgi:hypothetical protein